MHSAVDALQTRLTPQEGNSACLSDLEGSITEPYAGCDCKHCLVELRRVRDKDGGGIGEPPRRRRESIRDFEARNPEVIREATVKQLNDKIIAYFHKEGEEGGRSPHARNDVRRLMRSEPRILMEMKKAAAEQLHPEMKHRIVSAGDEPGVATVDQVMAHKLVEECSVHQRAKECDQDDDGSGGDGMSCEGEIEDSQARRCGLGEGDDGIDGRSFNDRLKSLHDNSHATFTVSSRYHGALLPPPWYPDQGVSSINTLTFAALQEAAVSEDGEPRRLTSRDMPPPSLPKCRQDSVTDSVVSTEEQMNDGGEKKQISEWKREAEKQARRERELEAARAVQDTIERNRELSVEGAEDQGREIVLGPQGKWCDEQKEGSVAAKGSDQEKGAVALDEGGDGDWELL